MFDWFKKKRIRKLAGRAEEYVLRHYVEEEKSKNRFRRDITPEEVKLYLEIKANNKIPEQELHGDKQSDVKFSRNPGSGGNPIHGLKDNYDGGSIQRTIKSMSAATPTDAVIRALENSTNMTFVDKLLEHIDKRHMKDSDVYRAAQVDRRLYSKIISDHEYKPAKDTCVAFAFALELSIDEAEDLLSRAGYTLSHSSKRDVLLEYFFKEKIYNLFDINDILLRLDQKVLGRF